jgi:hypothetical protein
MESSKKLKELKKQLTSLQEELYRDYPSGMNFYVIMENMKSLIDPVSQNAYDKIWELYNKAPDCCTEDGEPYKDYNEYICKDLREGNIRDAILSQIYVISRDSNIELRDTSLDTVAKTNKSKLYFMLRYVYNELCLPKISYTHSDGEWTPVYTNFLDTIKEIFEKLRDYETANLFTELIGGIEAKSIPAAEYSDMAMSSLYQTPKFPCVKTKSIDSLIARLKDKIDAETSSTLINAVNGLFNVMSFGKYDINGVRRMIDI